MAIPMSGDSCGVTLLLLLVPLLSVGEILDIKPYYDLIVDHHNDIRRNVLPSAGDMRKMMWDDMLTRYAEVWSGHCRYERPSPGVYPTAAANLFYTRGHANNWLTIRSSIQRGLQAWTREKDYYKYSRDCGMACSYVQMVFSSTHRVGCALRTCPVLTLRDQNETRTTLFVCFYAPKAKLMGTYPYLTGSPCTSCPTGTECSENLCEIMTPEKMKKLSMVPPPAQLAALTAPRTGVLTAPRTAALAGPRTAAISFTPSTDVLTEREQHYLLQVHNNLRRAENSMSLVWDPELELWAKWVIRCEANYPGPSYCYTNFYRFNPTMAAYNVVYAWGQEDPDTSIEKGCRTPFDRSSCNHYTNMMQKHLTSMACAAIRCDSMRQLICIYDSSTTRESQR